MRFTVIVAARSGSRRLPGKALLPLDGKPMLGFLLERVMSSTVACQVVLATTQKPEDDMLARLAADLGVGVHRGEEDDLVARYVGACAAFKVDHAVRVTGDCPFVDAETLDHCLGDCLDHPGFDLATTKGLFPVGIDYEIFPARFLNDLARRPDLNAAHREHLTLYAYDNMERYKIHRLHPPTGTPTTRQHFTVDTPQDYARCQEIVQAAGGAPLSLRSLLRAGNALEASGSEKP